MTEVSVNVDQSKGRLLIVDDDPIVAGVLGVSLRESGFEIVELPSGEECLDRIAGIQPDAIFLDIEMPGIDGYETCRQLRVRQDTRDLSIIFLSARDDLDSRLTAFDVGADDFVAKPFVAEEVCRKANVAVRIKAERKKLFSEKAIADQEILLAFTSLEETNVILKFTRSSLGCHSLLSLAELTVGALKECGLTSHVQIRSHHGTLTVTNKGMASPLESSVIELSKDQGRIFQFKRRMIVNYDSISVLIIDMPVEDLAATGRIRDYVAMICESGEDAVGNINLRLDANSRANELRKLVEATRTALEKLHAVQRNLQTDTRVGLDQMVHTLEGMYISLGLLESQEYTISKMIRDAVTGVMEILDQGSAADGDFKVILENLDKASEYQVDVDNQTASAAKIELF
jgi:DNA-binding response OmpR family regulator